MTCQGIFRDAEDSSFQPLIRIIHVSVRPRPRAVPRIEATFERFWEDLKDHLAFNLH